MEALSAEKIRRFLDLGDGSGSGSDYSYEYGCGNGSARGNGSGRGNRFGDGYGYGSCHALGAGIGSKFGDGYGYGCSNGCGNGCEDGYGCGNGKGSGIKGINGWEVLWIDGVETVLHVVHESFAKGAILKNDMTIRPCYVVKGQGNFAHGETLRSARKALEDKIMEEMPVNERLNAFVEKHPDYNKAYPNRDLYDWHHKLTGSCEMGRDEFVKSHGLSLEGETKVAEFVKLTKETYGGSVIRQLPEAYGITGGVRDE